MKVFKTFFNYMKKEGHIKENPTANIKNMKQPKVIVCASLSIVVVPLPLKSSEWKFGMIPYFAANHGRAFFCAGWAVFIR